MKELEQVYCKFYNELGRILVKDFVPVQQAEELSPEPEDDSSSSAPQDTGRRSPPIWLHPSADHPPPRVPSESSAVGAVEDRKKVPWSDKETIILLEIWGDTQVSRHFQGLVWG